MSNESVSVTPEQMEANERFLREQRESSTERWINRHSLQARLTHGIFSIACILLVISGLFVFIPVLANIVGGQAVYVIRMCHRIIGIIFIAVPIISGILAPRGVKHMFGEMLHKWDSDDRKWMMLFFPYLFMAKWIHMPDQHETKSGQRFADGMLVVFSFVLAISGLLLIFESSFLNWGNIAHATFLFIHDLGFFGICVFGMAHIFLGGGIFQPYRGTARLMFGDGNVSESNALYHWAHWARKELSDGKNVVYKEKEQK